jgi:hypothetical protein
MHRCCCVQVASYMRAVLRTLAQCHAHRILHRDVKPGNFMLLTEAEDSPLKAIGMRHTRATFPGACWSVCRFCGRLLELSGRLGVIAAHLPGAVRA